MEEIILPPNKKTRRKQKEQLQPEFRRRLEKYLDLLEVVEREYSRGLRLPDKESLLIPTAVQRSIFDWHLAEVNKIHKAEMETRLRKFSSLKHELISILIWAQRAQIPTSCFYDAGQNAIETPQKRARP